MTSDAAPTAPHRVPPWTARALAVLAGTLYFLGFAGFEIWPLSLVSLVPLLVALRGRTGAQGFRLGWLMGTVTVGGGFYWIAPMLKTFSGFPLPLCVLFAAILWSFQGLQFGFMAWLITRADARGMSRLLSVPAAVATSELVFPVLFPWYTANSLHAVPLLIQTADLGGPTLVSAAMALGHAALEQTLLRVREGSAAWSARLRPLALPLAFWVFAIPYGLFRIHQVDADTSPTLRVGVVQENLGLMEKRNDPYEALARHLQSTRELERQGVDLVVWSESAIAFRIPEEITNIRDYIPEWDLNVPVMFGALSIRPARPGHGLHFGNSPSPVELFNTAFITAPDGTLRGRYDKVYLLAFGEYLPFGETFPKLYEISPNSGHFTPGSTFRPLPLPRGAVTPLICYEDILPRFVRDMQRSTHGNVLAVILNDAWFGDTVEPWIHDALGAFRAVEQRRDLIRSANSGVSSVIDAAGREVAHSRTFTRATVRANVRLREGRTVYSYLGDWLAWICVAVSLSNFIPRRKASA